MNLKVFSWFPFIKILFKVFIENIGSDCAVKRRCTAQNCINLIEHACNKPLMAKYALNKVIGKQINFCFVFKISSLI